MSGSDDVIAAIRTLTEEEALTGQLTGAVRQGIEAQATKARTFNTHSQALRGRLHAEQQAIAETLADLEAKRLEIIEQIEDAMLTHSMITHALDAAERGTKR